MNEKQQKKMFRTGKKVIARVDFEAKEPGELAMCKNDQFEIVNNNVGEGWILVKNIHTTEQGIVPERYLKLDPTNSESGEEVDEKPKQSKKKGILSKLVTTKSGAIADFIFGVNLPSDEPTQNQWVEISLVSSKPVWAHNKGFHIKFGERQGSSKLAGLKKTISISVTPTTTNKPVMRRYKHFKWLWDRLQELYPVVAVPALPGARITGMSDEVFIRDREQKLLQCMNKMSLHPVISKSKVFRNFVKISEKKKTKWKESKRKAETNPHKNINSYLIFTGDATTQPCFNTKQLSPALEAYDKHATEIYKRSKTFITALETLTTTFRGPMSSSYATLGRSLSTLGDELKKGLPHMHLEDVCLPNLDNLGMALQILGTRLCEISDKFESQPEKDWELLQNQFWVQAGSLERLPKILRTSKLAFEALADKATVRDDDPFDRLKKIQAATLAEINYIQITSAHDYLDMMKTLVSEQINFYKSLVEILEPHLIFLNDKVPNIRQTED